MVFTPITKTVFKATGGYTRWSLFLFYQLYGYGVKRSLKGTKMKRITTIVVAMLLAGVCMAATLPYLNTTELPKRPGTSVAIKTTRETMRQMRIVSASDTPLNTSTRIWGNAQAIFTALDENWNQVSIYCVGYGDGNGAGDPASGSFSWSLYVCRPWGPPELAGTGTWAIGGLQCSHNPSTGIAVGTDPHFSTADRSNYKFAELPILSAEYWAGTVGVSGTTDHPGAINIDPLGCWGIYIEITDITSVSSLYFFTVGQ